MIQPTRVLLNIYTLETDDPAYKSFIDRSDQSDN